MVSPLNKPPYIDPAGDPRHGALPAAPPFVFRAVTSRVFPLKANMARLTAFCDQYVNMNIRPSIAYFRPSLPYVYLMVLNYGSMSPASVAAQNLGWVAQHEMTFTVPLEWWREENGRLVFQNWACVSPFIFVDDEMSLTTGREVYGWPKVLAQVDADVPLWTQNPLSGERVFSLSTCMFPKLYAGAHEVPRVLLQIDRAAAPTYSAFPPNPNNPWAPLTALADAARAAFGLSADAIDMLLAPRIRGYRVTRSAESLRAMLQKAVGNLAGLLPDLLPLRRGTPPPAEPNAAPRLSVDCITLKQFRAVEDPNAACYQALVTSRMGFDRLNQGGLLGDLHLLRGDPSGGFSVRIHRYGSQPIIESLGLEIAEEQTTGEGAPIAILKPTLPFWNDVDLFYDVGRVICSRTSGYALTADAPWRDEQVSAPAQAATVADPPPDGPEKIPYNTALGAATQPVSGPFTFPDVTLQAYPLLADPARLRAFVDRYMNVPLHGSDLHVRTCGSYVYMLVSVCDDQLGSMWSGTNNVGWWAEREVTFAVPVKVYKDGELVSVAFVTPFVYANSGRAVISDREVTGRPTVSASIEQPPDAWLTRSGPVAERRLLRLATELFPALNLGQRAERRTLLEIDQLPPLPYNADVGWHLVAEQWGVPMVEELKRTTAAAVEQWELVKKAKALTLEMLGHHLPFDWILLKQYRDAEQMDRACYQALVRTRRAITHVYDAREIEVPLHVRLHQSPGHPIVESLGLVVKSVDSVGGSVVQNLQPWRPFWMRIAVEEQLGEVLLWQDGDGGWKGGASAPWWLSALRLTPPPGSPPSSLGNDKETRVGAALGERAALFQNLADGARQWLRKALTHELAWLRVTLQALPAEQQAVWRQGLSSDRRAQLDHLLAADPFPAFCANMPTEVMTELVSALRAAAPELPPLPTLPMDAQPAPQNVADGLLAWMYDAWKALPAPQRIAGELSLPPDQRTQLEQLRAAGSVDAYAAHTTDTERAQLFIALQQAAFDWAYRPEDVRRLTYAEARETIEQLEEVQLVVESILSDEWEHWGNPRSRLGADRQPEQCVPFGSVYGTSGALKEARDQFVKTHGLLLHSRGDADPYPVWYVDPPKAPAGDR